MLEKPWISGIPSDKQERYKPVTKCTYWPVLGAFNNWNIIELSSKSTSSDKFDENNQVVLDGISYNMASLVESGKYGAINTTDTSTNGFYFIMFTSGAYTLQENTKMDGQIIPAGELVVNAKYICWFQYQLLSTCIKQIYFALTTNSPAVIICPSISVFSWSVYAPYVNMIT